MADDHFMVHSQSHCTDLQFVQVAPRKLKVPAWSLTSHFGLTLTSITHFSHFSGRGVGWGGGGGRSLVHQSIPSTTSSLLKEVCHFSKSPACFPKALLDRGVCPSVFSSLGRLFRLDWLDVGLPRVRASIRIPHASNSV